MAIVSLVNPKPRRVDVSPSKADIYSDVAFGLGFDLIRQAVHERVPETLARELLEHPPKMSLAYFCSEIRGTEGISCRRSEIQ
jgi:hypothetical protein